LKIECFAVLDDVRQDKKAARRQGKRLSAKEAKQHRKNELK